MPSVHSVNEIASQSFSQSHGDCNADLLRPSTYSGSQSVSQSIYRVRSLLSVSPLTVTHISLSDVQACIVTVVTVLQLQRKGASVLQGSDSSHQLLLSNIHDIPGPVSVLNISASFCFLLLPYFLYLSHTQLIAPLSSCLQAFCGQCCVPPSCLLVSDPMPFEGRVFLCNAHFRIYHGKCQ